MLLRGVEVWYPGSTQPALHEIDLEIRQGEFVLVLGHSGSGKSTLGKVIAGIIPHIERADIRGEIHVLGLDPRETSPETYSRRVAYLAQSPYDQVVFSRVEDELVFVLENVHGVADSETARHYLSLLGIEHLRDRKTSELSGGELQKLTIACVLALNPDVIIFDEPFAHLDPRSCQELRQILVKLRELGKTLILIEHRFREVLELIDQEVVDRVILLSRGTIAHILDSREVRHRLDLIAQFGIRLPLNLKLALALRRGVARLTDMSLVEEVLSELKQRTVHTSQTRFSESSAKIMLRVEDLWSGYVTTRRGLRREVRWVLRGVTLSMRGGQVYAVIGPNGSGKSTLLYSIVCAVPHIRGVIEVCGRIIRRPVDARGLVSLVPQNPDLVLMCETVEKELLVRAKTWAKSEQEAWRAVLKVCEELDLRQVLSKNPHALSRGQRFRVAIAAALVQGTPVVLLDEPTSGQDESCVELLGQVIREVSHGEGRLVVVVTHDLDFVYDYADLVLVIRSGELVRIGMPLDVLSDEDLMSSCGLLPHAVAKLARKHGLELRQHDILNIVSTSVQGYAS